MASSRMTAPKGRTYDRTVPDGSNLHKHLACRAVPHMSQSQSSTPIPRLTGSNLHAETHKERKLRPHRVSSDVTSRAPILFNQTVSHCRTHQCVASWADPPCRIDPSTEPRTAAATRSSPFAVAMGLYTFARADHGADPFQT